MKQSVKWSVGCLAIVLFIVAAFVGTLAWVFHTGDWEITLHTAKVRWLPPSAKDVSRKARSGIIDESERIECTLPEADFLVLAKTKQWKIEEKENFGIVPLRMSGLPTFREVSGIPDVVLHGYFYEKRGADGGGISVAYDRDLHRLFYWRSAH